MTRAYWSSPVTPLHLLSGAAFANFTAFQDISPAPAVVLGANQLETGSELRLEAWGEFSNTATPTLSLGFFFGTAAVVLGQTALTTTTTGATSWPWHLYLRGRVRTVGATGTIYCQGYAEIGTSLTAYSGVLPLPTTAAGRVVTIDTTTAKTHGVGAQWGAASASNTLKTDMFNAELI